MLTRKLKGDITEETVYVYHRDNGLIMGTFTRRINDSSEVEYVFVPNWENFDFMHGNDVYVNGFDMSLRQKEYVRYDTCAFMTEHMPPYGREDNKADMIRVGLNCPYDMWAFMVESGRVTNDVWRVCRIPGATYEHDKYI